MKKLQGFNQNHDYPLCSKGLQRVTRGYRGLQGVTGGDKGLQGVTKGYRGLQGVAGEDKGLQRVRRGDRG